MQCNAAAQRGHWGQGRVNHFYCSFPISYINSRKQPGLSTPAFLYSSHFTCLFICLLIGLFTMRNYPLQRPRRVLKQKKSMFIVYTCAVMSVVCFTVTYSAKPENKHFGLVLKQWDGFWWPSCDGTCTCTQCHGCFMWFTKSWRDWRKRTTKFTLQGSHAKPVSTSHYFSVVSHYRISAKGLISEESMLT